MNIRDKERMERDLERFPAQARGFYEPRTDLVTKEYFALRCKVCGAYVLYMGEEQLHSEDCPVPYAQELMIAEDYRDKTLHERST